MRMRATFGSAAPSLFPILTSSFPISLPPLTIYLGQAYLRHHFGAFSRPAVDFQVAAQQCHPLTHAGETQTLARPTPPSVILSGLKPGPQSRTCRRTESFRRRSVILTRAEGACLWTLERASCATRKSAVSTSGGRRSSPRASS